MSERVDRRSFLATAGAAGLALAVEACGASAPSVRRIAAATPHTLQGAIRGHVFKPGSPGFTAAAQVFNERFDGIRPHAVARPVDPRDVQAAVKWLVGK